MQCCHLSLPLFLPPPHTLPIYLCAPTWFTTTFSPVRLPPPFRAAMFDLISSKLSSVSTENTSVSFPASLSVSVLATLPLPLPPLCPCFSLCVLFLKGAQLTHPTGCPSPFRLLSLSLFTLPAFAHSHPHAAPSPPLLPRSFRSAPHWGVCLILECFLCSICFNLMLFCPEISQLALYSACISDVPAPSMINGIKGFACTSNRAGLTASHWIVAKVATCRSWPTFPASLGQIMSCKQYCVLTQPALSWVH